ncbi:MAG: enoyl-[acyl-carrier-protein] reductase FabK [Deltaproteobacteria bacterium]|nr:MAG: enoyl-[acyl-carrier-protein] reductase FabK [Deltaproteobacteria bacterium]
MIKSELCEILGIKYPIIQGGMAWAGTAELASAVSNAGGLGMLGAGVMSPARIKEEIKKTKERTDKPFGVNIYYLSPDVNELVDVVIEEAVPVITTGAGNPGKDISKLKDAGIKVLPVVASVALARRLARLAVTALIAEGMEGGGHVGELTTMAMLPQMAQAVEIPLVAAGGIADGRGLAAAFALGARGVQMGTRFLCSEECIAHPNFKQAVIEATDRSTIVTARNSGHPVRVLKNRLSRRFAQLEAEGVSKEELMKIGEGALRAAVIDGDVNGGSLMAGQIAGLIKEIKPVKEIIEEITADAEGIIKRMGHLVH